MRCLGPIVALALTLVGCQAVLIPDGLDSSTDAISDAGEESTGDDGGADGAGDGGTLEDSQCLMRTDQDACDAPTSNGEVCIWREVHQVDVLDGVCLIGSPQGYCVPQSDLQGCDEFLGCTADASHSVWFRIEGGQFFVTKREDAECGTPQGFSVCSYGSANLDDRCTCACEL